MEINQDWSCWLSFLSHFISRNQIYKSQIFITMLQTPSTDNETLPHTSSYYITPGNSTSCSITLNALDLTATAKLPILADKPAGVVTSHILHGLSWRQTRFLWRPLCVSQKHAAVIGTPHCAPAERGLSLCVHVYCAEDTASRFQPLTHCHNSESRRKKKQNTQSSGRKASASAFVWVKLSITGADRRVWNKKL